MSTCPPRPSPVRPVPRRRARTTSTSLTRRRRAPTVGRTRTRRGRWPARRWRGRRRPARRVRPADAALVVDAPGMAEPLTSKLQRVGELLRSSLIGEVQQAGQRLVTATRSCSDLGVDPPASDSRILGLPAGSSAVSLVWIILARKSRAVVVVPSMRGAGSLESVGRRRPGHRRGEDVDGVQGGELGHAVPRFGAGDDVIQPPLEEAASRLNDEGIFLPGHVGGRRGE